MMLNHEVDHWILDKPCSVP